MHFFMRYLEMRFVMTRLSVKNMQMQRAIGDWYFLINHAVRWHLQKATCQSYSKKTTVVGSELDAGGHVTNLLFTWRDVH